MTRIVLHYFVSKKSVLNSASSVNTITFYTIVGQYVDGGGIGERFVKFMRELKKKYPLALDCDLVLER